MVVLMLLKALVFKLMSREARLDLVAAGGEDASPEASTEAVGGRCDTQSWTSRETRGFDWRFNVFFDEGFVVMMIIG